MHPRIKTTKVLVMIIFLNIITFGYYMIYWYFNRRPGLNSLKSEKSLPKEWIIILLITYLVDDFLWFFQDGRYYPDSMIWIFWIIMIPLWLMIDFRIRRILIDHTGEYVSPFLTFFFGHLYLQYKINRFNQEPDYQVMSA